MCALASDYAALTLLTETLNFGERVGKDASLNTLIEESVGGVSAAQLDAIIRTMPCWVTPEGLTRRDLRVFGPP